MAAHRIGLKWEQAKCGRCGNTRIRGETCPDCGLPPKDHEFNRPLQLRQRAANAALAILDEKLRDVKPLDVFTLSQSGFWTTTGDWLVRLLTACGDVASSLEGSEPRLVKTVGEFMKLHSQIAALKPLRPYIRGHAAATSVMKHLEKMTRAYLGALSASTPLVLCL
jgi:ribosomal protein L32